MSVYLRIGGGIKVKSCLQKAAPKWLRATQCALSFSITPDSKVHGANTGPIWGRHDPGGPHVGPMNFDTNHLWVLNPCLVLRTYAYLPPLRSDMTASGPRSVTWKLWWIPHSSKTAFDIFPRSCMVKFQGEARLFYLIWTHKHKIHLLIWFNFQMQFLTWINPDNLTISSDQVICSWIISIYE